MSALADIFAAVRLQLDGTGFEAQATALATKSGKNAGTAMSQNINDKLKKAVGGAIGAGAGLALGAIANGTLELDSATRQLQSDTGMAADEAERAKKAMTGMYRDNLQGFGDIAEVMAVVHNDLGLTGDAANTATESFLRFATATNQTAVTAARDFDDILDAFNLTATATPVIMDKLIASHQQYGGVISGYQTALVAMAPALGAMNMGVDEGIALLNLFQTAGIDASKAPVALATAMKKLKPGQDINDLIAQISAIEDPTLRAQKAIEIFGVRGGVQLAQAFTPGIKSLDQFKVSTEESAGATERAADVVESSLDNQVTLALKNAKGALIEFGNEWGGLATVLGTVSAIFGPAFTKALGAGLGGLAGFFGPKLLALILPEGIAAGTTAGAATGSAFGIAIGPAIALAIPAAILIGLTAAKPTIQKWLDDMGLKVPDLFEGQGPLAPPGQIVPVGTQTTYAEGNAAAHEAAMKAAGASDAAAIAAGLASGAPKMLAASKDLGYNVLDGVRRGMQTVSVDKVFAAFGTSLKGVMGASRALAHTGGVEGMLAMAAGIESERAKPLDAFTTMVEMLKHAMTPAAEAARLAGELTSKALADGLHSADPEVRAQAIAVKEAALDRLVTLVHETGSIGKKAMAELDAGIHSKIPAIRSTSIAAKVAVMKELGKTASEAGPAGKAAMAALDAGIRSKVPEVSAAALAAKNAAVAQLNATAGPAGSAGAAAGAAFASRLRASIAAGTASVNASTGFRLPARAAGGPVTAGMPYIVNENTPRSEWFVPAVSGRIATAAQAESQSAGRGRQTIINIAGLVRAETPEDVARVLRRAEAF